MSIKLYSMFDNYTLKARFYPVIILFIPVLITGAFYSFEFKSVVHVLTSLGIFGALTYLFSQLGRDQGKIKEPALWKGWGGCPSVQLLRLNNQVINRHTKFRYHQKLQILCPLSVIPDVALEASDPAAADDVYMAWNKYLISKTRDGEKFSLLLKDNTSYGFRRNLWGLKRHAITIIIFLMLGNYAFGGLKMKGWNLMRFNDNFKYSSLALTGILVFWILIVTKKWVRITAFSYAERLCETTELL